MIARGFLELAIKGKSGVRGRPSKAVKFAPGAAQARAAGSGVQAVFKDRKSADKWMRTRLARQVDDYDFLIDQLKLDLSANTDACAEASDGKGVGSELMRARQSILTSMRTLMSGQQELMISLMKTRNLLGDLGGEDEGGDVTIQVQPLPPTPEAAPHGKEAT